MYVCTREWSREGKGGTVARENQCKGEYIPVLN
jgi:hypothetical protein